MTNKEKLDRTERLRLLAEVDLLILDSLVSLEDGLAKILEIGNKVVPSDKGINIILWDEKEESFTLSASSVENLSPEEFSKNTRSESGVTRRIVDSLDVLVVNDIKDDPFRKGRKMKDYGVKSYIGVPIQSENKAIGVFFVFNEKPQEYSDDDILFCTLLANRAASAIKNANYILELQKKATRDGLTGLLNRRSFFEIANKFCEDNKRNKKELSIIFFDVDNFKQFNDNYGHHVGDKVLEVIGTVILKSIRDMDVAARYGGDEFVILFPETSKKELKIAKNRILKTLENTEWEFREAEVEISIGQATSKKACSISELIELADNEMYKVKKANKDKGF